MAWVREKSKKDYCKEMRDRVPDLRDLLIEYSAAFSNKNFNKEIISFTQESIKNKLAFARARVQDYLREPERYV